MPGTFKLFFYLMSSPSLLLGGVMSITSSLAQDHPLTKDFLLGKETTNFYKRHFRKVDPRMCSKPIFLVKEVADAFEALYRAAERDSIRLTLLSGLRTFAAQKRIWEHKYHHKYRYLFDNETQKIKKIMEYSAMPGTSRHHWGSDIDVVSLHNAFFKKGYGQKVFLWLKKNGRRFGFIQVYTAGRGYGYKEERWHYTYFPLSAIYLKAYKKHISAKDIYGFSGDHLVEKLNIINQYVFGINSELFGDELK